MSVSTEAPQSLTLRSCHKLCQKWPERACAAKGPRSLASVDPKSWTNPELGGCRALLTQKSTITDSPSPLCQKQYQTNCLSIHPPINSRSFSLSWWLVEMSTTRMSPSGAKTFFTTTNTFEKKFGYHRAVRKGPFIFVSGTTALNPRTSIVEHAEDAQRQALAAMKRGVDAVEELGGKLEDILRVRMFVAVCDFLLLALKLGRPVSRIRQRQD